MCIHLYTTCIHNVYYATPHSTPALCVTGSTTLYPYTLSCLRNIRQLRSIACFLLTYPSIPFGVVHAVRVTKILASVSLSARNQLIIVKHIFVAEKLPPSSKSEKSRQSKLNQRKLS